MSKRRRKSCERRQRARAARPYVIISLAGRCWSRFAFILPSPDRRHGLCGLLPGDPAAMTLAPRIDRGAGDPIPTVGWMSGERFQCGTTKIFTGGTEQQLIELCDRRTECCHAISSPSSMDGCRAANPTNPANAAMCAWNRASSGNIAVFSALPTGMQENQGLVCRCPPDSLRQILGLDMETFDACFSGEPLRKDEIGRDYLDTGPRLQVSGHANVFVSGVMVAPGYILGRRSYCGRSKPLTEAVVRRSDVKTEQRSVVCFIRLPAGLRSGQVRRRGGSHPDLPGLRAGC